MPSSSGGRIVAVGRAALGVVPDQQLAVALHASRSCWVRARSGTRRGVRDRLALAVAAPAPVVERAGDLVALDRALGQVAAHVPAVAVEHVELALGVRPDDELAAERLDRVRLAVREGLGQAQAVPAAGEPLRRRAAVEDSAGRAGVGSSVPPSFR